MKWAIIGILAVIVLGGAGYAIYTLTSAPEDAQAWWDEKKLENFDTIANRELDDYQKKIETHKKTLHDLKVQRVLWAGDKSLGDANFKEQKDTGFWTLYGYTEQKKFRNAQGEALGKAYKAAASKGGVVTNADTGEADLPEDTLISVNLPQKNGTSLQKEMKPSEIITYLGQIEDDLVEVDANIKGVQDMVDQYDQSIAAWENQIKKEEQGLTDLRKQVKTISAQIKLQKAKEDLNELNKTINGESDNSELGKLIRNFETKKTKFKAEELVAADEGKKGGKSISLADLEKPSTSGSGHKTSRFLK